jgi:hypothetical protein
MLSDTERFRCPANVAARVLDGEAIMIHLETGRYFSAEGVAAILWHLLDSGVPFGDIVARVADRFGLPLDRAREDVDRFVAELVREELLVTEREAAGTVLPGVVAEFGNTPYSTPTLRAYRDMADLLALDPPMPSLKPAG